jgi:hypothetical protein
MCDFCGCYPFSFIICTQWRFLWYRWKHFFFKHIYLWLHLAQYRWSLANDNVPSLHILYGFWEFVRIRKHISVPCGGGHVVKASHLSQLLTSVPHNLVQNYKWVIGFLGFEKVVLHAATYIINIFIIVISNKKKNIWCLYLWDWFRVLYDALSWSATSILRMWLVYFICMVDIEIASCTIPIRQGLMSTGIHKKSIGVKLVDRRMTSFLFFYKTKNIKHDSCILYLNP